MPIEEPYIVEYILELLNSEGIITNEQMEKMKSKWHKDGREHQRDLCD